MTKRVAVIFDLDGVIVDTVASLYQVYTEILGGFGVTGSRNEFDRLNGSNLDEIVLFLKQQHGLHEREHEIRQRFENRFSLLYTQVDLVDGIEPVLQILKEHSVTISLASASSRGNIDAVLRRFNLSRYFDFVVSGDEVARAKPHPDIYRLAKDRCKCIEHFVIEDSHNGVQAAKHAGLVAIYFNPNDEPNSGRASYNISHLSDISRIILEDKAVIISKAERIEIRRENRKYPISKRGAQQVEKIWSDALKEKPSMFNGDVASYHSHETLPNGTLVVDCFPSQYKHIFAGLHDRRLNLSFPIGVSAFVIDKNEKVLLGKRSKHVTEYQGHFEFVPSGGITIQNMAETLYLEQLKEELIEETGIKSKSIKDIIPFSLIYDRTHGVFDICAKVFLDCSINPATLTSKEYSSFVLMDYDLLEEFFSRESVVPTSEAMYRAII